MFDRRQSIVTSRPKAKVNSDSIGRILNVLEPGDIILAWNDNSVLGKAISRYQGKYPSPSNEIVHVALYSGFDEVTHARFDPLKPKQSVVRKQAFSEYFLDRDISAVVPSGLPIGWQAEVLRQVDDLTGRTYDPRIPAWEVLASSETAKGFLGWMGVNADHQLEQATRDGVICSSVVEEIFNTAYPERYDLFDLEGRCSVAKVTLPANFFPNPKLLDVTIDFAKRLPGA